MTNNPLQVYDFTSKQTMLKYVDSRLSELRENLEATNIDHRLSDDYRGRIAELKQIKEYLTE